MKRDEARIDVGDVSLHVVSEGQGTPVILLHGFLEHWYAWRHQMTALAAAGFRAIAPDQRGYNLSDKPKGYRAYAVTKLADDVAGLIRSLGHPKVHLVGHDWGGVVAWFVADRHPDLIDRIVIINGSHPVLLARRLRSPSQLLKSWYMFFFLVPRLPEALLSRKLVFKQALVGSAAKPAALTDEYVDRLYEAFSQPGAAEGSVNWYRAMFRAERPKLSKVCKPTLMLWGEQDTAMGVELLDGLEEWVEPLTVERYPEASHWLNQELPDEVSRRIVGFLRNGARPTARSEGRASDL
jgi:epoxide hydrolase 4